MAGRLGCGRGATRQLLHSAPSAPLLAALSALHRSLRAAAIDATATACAPGYGRTAPVPHHGTANSEGRLAYTV